MVNEKAKGYLQQDKINMKEILKRTFKTELGHMNIQMEVSILGSGLKENLMEKGLSHLMMAVFIQVIMQKIDEKDRESCNGLKRKRNTEGNGLMAKKKDMELKKYVEKYRSEESSSKVYLKLLFLKMSLTSCLSLSMKLKILRQPCQSHQQQLLS